MELTYGHLRNPEFASAFRRLVQAPLKSVKVAYSLSRTVQAVDTEGKVMDAAWRSIVNAHAEKDADGKVVIPKDGDGNSVMIPKERMEEFIAAAKEFDAIAFDAKGRKLTLDEIETAQLSAQDMVALEPLIEG